MKLIIRRERKANTKKHQYLPVAQVNFARTTEADTRQEPIEEH
jgi:hypothetical protein